MPTRQQLLFVIAAFVCAVTCEAEPPALNAGKMSIPPILDGKINLIEWGGATKIKDFHLFKGERAGASKPKYPTTAWIGCDKENLYIAVRCDKGDIRNLKANERQRDGKIYHDDSVEIFLNTASEENSYYHFTVNSLGTLYDGFASGSSAKIRKWSSDRWRAAAWKGKDFWSVEIAIPFAILRFGQNPIIRFNITRNNYSPYESISWCPIKSISGWHRPEQFGYLSGLDIADYQSLTIERIDPGKLLIGKNNLPITVRNNTEHKETLAINIRVSDGSKVSIITDIAPQKQKLIKVPFKINSPGEYRFNLTISRHPSRQLLYALNSNKYNACAGTLFMAPAFYDNKPAEGNILLFIDKIPDNCRLRISLIKDGTFLERHILKIVSARNSFSLGKLSPGYYEARLEIIDSKQRKLWSYNTQLWVVKYFLLPNYKSGTKEGVPSGKK